MSNLNRFMGGSPGSVLVKLLFLSLLVGAFMAYLDLTPFTLFEGLFRWLHSVLNISFESVRDVLRWILYGAIVVIPLWLLSRLLGRK